MKAKTKRSVVLFLDDQEIWHQAIRQTANENLSRLKNNLTNCEIISVYNQPELFQNINQLIDDLTVTRVLIFLDLGLPDTKDGLEVLNRISRNKNKKISQIPVYIYSVSKDPSDVSAAYSRLSQGYYHKLEHPEAFWDALQKIDEFKAYHLPQAKFDGELKDQPKNDIPSRYLIK